MEKLKKEGKVAVINAIKQLEKGDISTPIDSNCNGNIKDILSEIDALRQSMVENSSAHTKEIVEIERNVANLTHDLKTPIAVIEGYAECLEDGLAEDNYPTLIRTEAENMNQMVVNIIDSARTNEGRLREEKKLVSLRELLTYDYNQLEKHRTYEIKFKRIPNVEVFAAEKAFRNIFINLATNAIQHSKKE